MSLSNLSFTAMKFIHQSQLDKVAWDNFVGKNFQGLFSRSWYLDSCATDWCVLIDKNWENGIALPFTTNLGIENLTPIIFGRTIDFIGNDANFQTKALNAIQKRFKIGQLQTTQKLPINPEKTKVHQLIESEIKLGSQAKRMLKKAEKSGFTIQETKNWEGIIAIVESELTEKINEFNKLNLSRLRKLTQTLSDSQKLRCLGIFEAEKLLGGMLFITTPTVNIYLKGAALPEAKQQGGMYLCMHTFILQTLSENKTFDFGGSSIEGVQRFNHNFGGKNKLYFIYEWNRAPWWYLLAKKIYHFIKNNK